MTNKNFNKSTATIKKFLCASICTTLALSTVGCNTTTISENNVTKPSFGEITTSATETTQETSTGTTTAETTIEETTIFNEVFDDAPAIPERPEYTERKELSVSVSLESLMNIGKENVENSLLPRLDINMELDVPDITKLNYTDAIITISNSGDEASNVESAVGKIKLRGNSTLDAKKKSIKIKFNEKQTLFNGSNSKSWALLANPYDMTSGVHNYVAYNLYRYITPDDKFVPNVTFVDLYINDRYQGIYTICDQIDAAKDKINIDNKLAETPEETDYLIEQDMRAYYGDDYYKENITWFWMNADNVAFTINNIDEADLEGSIDETGVSPYTVYVKSYMDNVYTTICSKDWDKIQETIDVESIIEGFLINEVIKNQDIDKASVYYTIPKDGKLTYATIWDCDLAFGGGEIGEPDSGLNAEKNIIFGNLMQVPEFREMYITYFNEHIDDIYNKANELIDDISTKYNAELSNEYLNWSIHYRNNSLEEMRNFATFDEQISYMKDWLNRRVEFLKTQYTN